MNNKVNYIKEVSNRVLHSAKFLEKMGFFNKEIKESLFLKQTIVNTLDKINRNQNDFNLIEETLNFYFDIKKSIYENADLLVKSYIFQNLPDVFDDDETKREFVFNLQKIDFDDIIDEDDDLLEIIETIEKEAKKLFTLINSIITDIDPDTSVDDLYLVLYGTSDTDNGIDNTEENGKEQDTKDESDIERNSQDVNFKDIEKEIEKDAGINNINNNNSDDNFVEKIENTVENIKESMVTTTDVFQSPTYAITTFSSKSKKETNNKIKKSKVKSKIK